MLLAAPVHLGPMPPPRAEPGQAAGMEELEVVSVVGALQQPVTTATPTQAEACGAAAAAEPVTALVEDGLFTAAAVAAVAAVQVSEDNPDGAGMAVTLVSQGQHRAVAAVLALLAHAANAVLSHGKTLDTIRLIAHGCFRGHNTYCVPSGFFNRHWR